MKNQLLLVLAFFWSIQQNLCAQNRYKDEVFSDFTKTTVRYAKNYSVITIPLTGHTILQPLFTDLYMPEGDVETKRPLIVYLHGGNFLPVSSGASCSGNRGDSCSHEIASRLARMGYVVAVADYRLGWRPDIQAVERKKFTLVNAIYRGIQDVRTCIRFFRHSIEAEGNPYGIDSDRITVWGQEGGAFIALGAAYMNSYLDLEPQNDPYKFHISEPSSPTGYLPMIVPDNNGDIYGIPPQSQKACVVDPAYALISGYTVGDTLCIGQYESYSSDFRLCVNMGGVLADSSWLNAGEMPLISFHVNNNSAIPCGTGGILGIPLLVPPVIEVSGPCTMYEQVERYDNNALMYAPYNCIQGTEDISHRGFRFFTSLNTGLNNPWAWKKGPNPPPPSPLSSCNVNATLSRGYIDSILYFFTTRACGILDLGQCCAVDSKELTEAEIALTITPVPAMTTVELRMNEPVQQLYVFDITGRIVRHEMAINSPVHTLSRGNLMSGMYIVEVVLDEFRRIRKKIVWE